MAEFSLFSLFGKRAIDYFSDQDKEDIKTAIQEAEKQTSGEVRIYIEHYCRFKTPMDRAAHIFHKLKMDATPQHNGTLIYIALKHKKMALYGDAGINAKVDQSFWQETLAKMKTEFSHENYTKGIISAVHSLGQALASYFPYDEATNKNDLPDDMVFGKR